MAVISSPHLHSPAKVSGVMLQVIYALVPALLLEFWFFGWGLLLNLLLTLAAGYLFEAAMLQLRGRPLAPFLSDGSMAVTAVLLAAALPPLLPFWVPVVGMLFAIVIAKHLYGGLGYNPFNPAMVGYVVLLISFPLEMSGWVAPGGWRLHDFGLGDSLNYAFSGQLPPHITLDAITGATPLDAMRTGLGLAKTVSEVESRPLFGLFAGRGFEWVNLLVLSGGLWLIFKRIIPWHTPVGLLGGLFVTASLFHLVAPDQFAGPLFHLLSGGAMLGAFFIATDPVTCATSNRGRLIFGAGAGVLIFVIRTWGGYPDGTAFAVLLMNMAAPTIDYYTQPRVYGHGGSE